MIIQMKNVEDMRYIYEKKNEKSHLPQNKGKHCKDKKNIRPILVYCPEAEFCRKSPI